MILVGDLSITRSPECLGWNKSGEKKKIKKISKENVEYDNVGLFEPGKVLTFHFE